MSSGGLVTCWFAFLDEIRVVPVELEGLLDRNEKARLEEMTFPHRRDEFLLGRAMARELLCVQYDVEDPLAWRFDIGEHGRPHVAAPESLSDGGPNPVHFSITHAPGVVAVATARLPLGLDTEPVERRGDFRAITRRYFSPLEQELVSTAPPKSQQRYFYTLWTLKEAYVKALGTGLATSLSTFSIELAESRVRLLGETDGCWELLSVIPREGFRAALCVARSLNQADGVGVSTPQVEWSMWRAPGELRPFSPRVMACSSREGTHGG